MWSVVQLRRRPKYHPPAPQAPAVYKESPTQFKDADGWKVASPQDAMLRGKWWEVFNDPELNALEDQLDINNQNIKQYFENFMAARSLVREARSQYFPTLTTSPSYSRSSSSANLRGEISPATGLPGNTNQSQTFSDFSLPFDVSWEPDLWGRVRNTVREYEYAAQVSAADLQGERLTEQATLAQYFFELRGQDALQKLDLDTVEADTKTLAMTRSLYETGIGDQIAVVESQNTLQTAQAAAIGTGVARAEYEHAIAVLVGKVASNFSLPVRDLNTSPPPIPIGVPSQLLERRPDVAAAERTMAEANAQIGIARAAYFPNLTLSAQGGFESSSASNWLSWPSRFWSIGPSLVETIFDAGLRRATVHQYVAVYNADLASYRQTVLTAFQQVEDYLAAVRILSQQILKQKEAVASAQSFLNLELDDTKRASIPMWTF